MILLRSNGFTGSLLICNSCQLLLSLHTPYRKKWLLTNFFLFFFNRRTLVLEVLLFIITNSLDVQTCFWQTWLETKWLNLYCTRLRDMLASLNIYSININLGKQTKGWKNQQHSRLSFFPLLLSISTFHMISNGVWPWSISTSSNWQTSHDYLMDIPDQSGLHPRDLEGVQPPKKLAIRHLQVGPRARL